MYPLFGNGPNFDSLSSSITNVHFSIVGKESSQLLMLSLVEFVSHDETHMTQINNFNEILSECFMYLFFKKVDYLQAN